METGWNQNRYTNCTEETNFSLTTRKETQFRSISGPSPSRYPAIIDRCRYYDYGKTTVLLGKAVARPIRGSHVIFKDFEATATQPCDDHITDQRTYRVIEKDGRDLKPL